MTSGLNVTHLDADHQDNRAAAHTGARPKAPSTNPEKTTTAAKHPDVRQEVNTGRDNPRAERTREGVVHVSYRHDLPHLDRLCESAVQLINTFNVNGNCFRLCLNKQGHILCPIYDNNRIHVFSLQGELQDTIQLPEGIERPRSLHPLPSPSQHLLLAVRSGTTCDHSPGPGGGRQTTWV